MGNAPNLDELRREIDRIDEKEMADRLLMERGTIIDRLIAVKKDLRGGLSPPSGPAARPR